MNLPRIGRSPISVLLLLALAPLAVQAADLELYGFLSDQDGATYLNLRITNRGRRPQTVLTQNPMLSGSGTNGRRAPILGIHFGFFGTSSESGGTWKFVPSLPTLAPVTLHRDETATMSVRLEPDLASVLADPDVVLHVDYTITADFAERFDLWTGKLTLRETVRTLRSR